MNIASMVLDRVQSLLSHKHPPEEPRPEPCARYSADAARAEGWEVNSAGRDQFGIRRYHLHRVEPSVPDVIGFRDDVAAWEHVVKRARSGSILHREALAMLDPAERTMISCFCGTWEIS